MTINDVFMAGLKAMERWREPQVRPALHADDAAPAEDPAQAAPDPFDGAWPPTLEELLAQVEELPPNTITLGASEDGLPFLLDLSNPAPGSLLAVGESGSGKSAWLRTLLMSAGLQNDPQTLHLSIIAAQPEAYLDLAAWDHCQEIFSPAEPVVADLLAELCALVEQRKLAPDSGPTLIVALDGLGECLDVFSPAQVENLARLVRHGPRSRLWVVAALGDYRPLGLEPRTLGALVMAFRTRLYGRLSDPRLVSDLALSAPDTRSQPAGLFLMPYGEAWIPVWACAEERSNQ